MKNAIYTHKHSRLEWIEIEKVTENFWSVIGYYPDYLGDYLTEERALQRVKELQKLYPHFKKR